MELVVRAEAVGLTDPGERAHNEDGFGTFPELGLFVVADGLGGGSRGSPAAVAIEAIAARYAEGPAGLDALAAAIQAGNAAILALAEREPSFHGCGATVAALALAGDRALTAHAGDCRAYRRRDGSLRQLTEDHSLLRDYAKIRRLSAKEMDAFPHKNVVTRALGLIADIDVDLRIGPARADDLYLLSTDGLHAKLPWERIDEILSGATPRELASYRESPRVDLETMAGRLVASTNAMKGTDNITCLLVRVS